jgi:lactate permease
MGVIFGTLSGVVKMDSAVLAPASGWMLGAACLLCGFAAARLLGFIRLWKYVLGLGVLMAVVQYALAVGGMAPLAALGAGLSGIFGGVLLSRRKEPGQRSALLRPLTGVLVSYGGLALLMTAIAWPGALRDGLYSVLWQVSFPEVVTSGGFITPAAPGQAFRPLVHPGSAIFLVALLTYAAYRRFALCAPGDLTAAARATWRSAAPASLGIITTVGLSTLMEHTGMTQQLAIGLAAVMGAAFPLVSPLVGILGAFATGSNNNSNVLFAPLQNTVAGLLGIDPRLLLAAQTAGGSLGSMIAPAKIAVGCSTVGLINSEGDVLRRTLFYGLGIGLVLGALALLFAQ